ncbi:MAG: type II toxin-antitoxin system HipA family toxin [Anaerolineaceae bacterium]
MKFVQDAKVILWGTEIGAVSWLEDRKLGVFQYSPEFIESGIQPSPIEMPLRVPAYQFPGLAWESFRGLPGMLSDSLPDKFGTAIINAWLARQDRTEESFSSVERLCIIASRGMGALEYEPVIPFATPSEDLIDIGMLVDLTNEILDEKTDLSVSFSQPDDREALATLVRVGTSAGGARAKAILDWNPKTGEFRSGQVPNPEGFEHWIIKFDGIKSKVDQSITETQGFGKIEYVYSQLARKAGITISETRLFQEGERSHFMTKRFDRNDQGDKIHMQSVGALKHIDYNTPRLFSYEETLMLMKQLELPFEDLEQFFIRAIFNVLGKNNDDHVKNVAFLMDRTGTWRLSPAYDLSFSFNPQSRWVDQHQMSINGKYDHITEEDIIGLGTLAGIKTKKSREHIDQVVQSLKLWPELAKEEAVSKLQIDAIQAVLTDEIENFQQ